MPARHGGTSRPPGNRVLGAWRQRQGRSVDSATAGPSRQGQRFRRVRHPGADPVGTRGGNQSATATGAGCRRAGGVAAHGTDSTGSVAAPGSAPPSWPPGEHGRVCRRQGPTLRGQRRWWESGPLVVLGARDSRGRGKRRGRARRGAGDTSPALSGRNRMSTPRLGERHAHAARTGRSPRWHSDGRQHPDGNLAPAAPAWGARARGSVRRRANARETRVQGLGSPAGGDLSGTTGAPRGPPAGTRPGEAPGRWAFPRRTPTGPAGGGAAPRRGVRAETAATARREFGRPPPAPRPTGVARDPRHADGQTALRGRHVAAASPRLHPAGVATRGGPPQGQSRQLGRVQRHRGCRAGVQAGGGRHAHGGRDAPGGSAQPRPGPGGPARWPGPLGRAAVQAPVCQGEADLTRGAAEVVASSPRHAGGGRLPPPAEQALGAGVTGPWPRHRPGRLLGDASPAAARRRTQDTPETSVRTVGFHHGGGSARRGTLAWLPPCRGSRAAGGFWHAPRSLAPKPSTREATGPATWTRGRGGGAAAPQDGARPPGQPTLAGVRCEGQRRRLRRGCAPRRRRRPRHRRFGSSRQTPPRVRAGPLRRRSIRRCALALLRARPGEPRCGNPARRGSAWGIGHQARGSRAKAPAFQPRDCPRMARAVRRAPAWGTGASSALAGGGARRAGGRTGTGVPPRRQGPRTRGQSPAHWPGAPAPGTTSWTSGPSAGAAGRTRRHAASCAVPMTARVGCRALGTMPSGAGQTRRSTCQPCPPGTASGEDAP